MMNPNIKIALGGGGDAADSRLLDEHFAKWIGAHGKLLYLPIALRDIAPFRSCFEWISTALSPFGISNITMWTELSQHQQNELAEFDAVYVGGGNTYSLLAELNESGFSGFLPKFAEQGGALYGGSAGAVVLGQDIGTVQHIDQNYIGIDNLSGMNLINDQAIWVHYRPQDDNLIQSYIDKIAHPVVAIPERSGVVVEGGTIQSVGFEPSFQFDRRTKTKL